MALVFAKRQLLFSREMNPMSKSRRLRTSYCNSERLKNDQEEQELVRSGEAIDNCSIQDLLKRESQPSRAMKSKAGGVAGVHLHTCSC